MPAAAPPAPAPLSHDQLRELELARGRRKKIDRALFVAGFNAWTIAVFAVLSLPFILFDFKSGLVGLGLGYIACREFAGRRKLKAADPDAASHLGYNQLALCGLIALYAGWRIIDTLTGPSRYAEAVAASPEIASTLEPIDELMTMASVAVYGCVLVLGVTLQGLTALYYFTRRGHIRAYLDETPAWVVEVQRRG